MRFVPRYSLRFALLALTIFLIVFGVGVKYWRDYQEHERVASQLVAQGNKVEEETDTLFGWVYAKRITILHIHCDIRAPERTIELLGQLPEPGALRRLLVCPSFSAFDPNVPDFVATKQFATALARLHNLEVFDLSIVFNEELVRAFQSLQKLKHLTLYRCQLSESELERSLAPLTQLESLQLDKMDQVHLNLEGLFRLDLPQLRRLWLTAYVAEESGHQGNLSCQRLPFTRAGLGRFPKLEFLGLFGIAYQELDWEPGALPNLRVLEMFEEKTAITFPDRFLQTCLPRLESLHLRLETLKTETITACSLMPALRHLSLRDKARELSYLGKKFIRQLTPEQQRLLEDLRQRCPRVQVFFDDESAFETVFEIPNQLGVPEVWNSKRWRKEQ